MTHENNHILTTVLNPQDDTHELCYPNTTYQQIEENSKFHDNAVLAKMFVLNKSSWSCFKKEFRLEITFFIDVFTKWQPF